MADSMLLDVARMVQFDADLRSRVEVALVAGGYVAADLQRVLTWLMAAPASTWGGIIDDPQVQAILAENPALADPGASLASLVTVTSDGPPLAPSWSFTSSEIPDALIIAGIQAAYTGRATNGLPLTRADEGSS